MLWSGSKDIGGLSVTRHDNRAGTGSTSVSVYGATYAAHHLHWPGTCVVARHVCGPRLSHERDLGVVDNMVDGDLCHITPQPLSMLTTNPARAV